jgi:hypothetical protein
MAPQDAVIQVGELPPKNNPPNDLVAGYPRLAGQLGKLPQLGIYRRFGALNARSILYLQAELTCLEKDLVAVEQDDENSNEDLRSDFCGNWADLSGYSSNGEKPSSQWKLVLEIRKKLKEYGKFLMYVRISIGTIVQSLFRRSSYKTAHNYFHGAAKS